MSFFRIGNIVPEQTAVAPPYRTTSPIYKNSCINLMNIQSGIAPEPPSPIAFPSGFRTRKSPGFPLIFPGFQRKIAELSHMHRET